MGSAGVSCSLLSLRPQNREELWRTSARTRQRAGATTACFVVERHEVMGKEANAKGKEGGILGKRMRSAEVLATVTFEDDAAVIIPQTHHVPRKESWDVFAPGQLESLLERCRTSSFKGLNLSKDSLFRSLSFNDDSFFDYR